MGAKSAAGGSHAFACRHWSESQASISLTIVDGDMILIRMNENPGTGYRWELVQANANLGTCGTVWLLIVLYGTNGTIPLATVLEARPGKAAAP